MNRPVHLATERHSTCIDMVEVHHASQSGRLSRAVRPEESGDSARGHVEAQIVDRYMTTESFGEPSDFDHDTDTTSAQPEFAATRAAR